MLHLINKQEPNRVCVGGRGGNERSYQNPAIVKLHQLNFEPENQHEEDPAQDDASVLDNQRGLGHCGHTARRISDADVGRNKSVLSRSGRS